MKEFLSMFSLTESHDTFDVFMNVYTIVYVAAVATLISILLKGTVLLSTGALFVPGALFALTFLF